jgi:hypothetical protein
MAMVLVVSALASSLESSWLVASGGSYPSSPSESGDKFASAVSSWFGSATAGPFPCSTASARKSQLASAATSALQAGDANAAGSQLALAIASYIAGQTFGAGLAGMPIAIAAAGAALGAAFSDRDQSQSSRAKAIADAVQLLTASTIVVFPPVISPPSPVS